jgi:hypothetical protein
MPDLDDVRGIALATVNALVTAGLIVGVPVLLARRIVRARRAGDRAVPLLIAPAAGLVATGLTVATRRTAWSLVRLWLRMDADRKGVQPSGR